jgi:hypothetical protein
MNFCLSLDVHLGTGDGTNGDDTSEAADEEMDYNYGLDPLP